MGNQKSTRKFKRDNINITNIATESAYIDGIEDNSGDNIDITNSAIESTHIGVIEDDSRCKGSRSLKYSEKSAKKLRKKRIFKKLKTNSKLEFQIKIMTMQVSKLVRLCRDDYESDSFISDDSQQCPKEFMESIRYVALYVDEQRTNILSSQIRCTGQEQNTKIQAMTTEAERLENICKDQRSKHRNPTNNDNSLCPPAFLQSMVHIEKSIDALRKEIDELDDLKNDDILERQEQNTKIQAMTTEAERLENICKDRHSKHRNPTKNDNSLCPPVFLQSMVHIEKSVDALRKEIYELNELKSDILERLSRVAGLALKNNLHIKDLYDNSNRVMVLAGNWVELYDGEWTDAFCSFEERYSKKKHKTDSEEQFIYHLFGLIKVIYQTCQTKAKEQVATFLLLTNPCSTQVNEMWLQIPEIERLKFTDSRKGMAEANIKMLQEIIIKDYIYKEKIRDLNPCLDKEMLDILENSSYFKKCVKICWRFVIQDPPLFLDFSPLVGEMLNKDEYKEFTKSGVVVKYVVWPALYMHCTEEKKRRLLAKGVVQLDDLTIEH